MEKYNKYDVLALEELYLKLRTWEPTVNYSSFSDEESFKCVCGSEKFRSKGYAYTCSGKFKRYVCTSCGKNYQSKQNELTLEKKKSILK